MYNDFRDLNMKIRVELLHLGFPYYYLNQREGRPVRGTLDAMVRMGPGGVSRGPHGREDPRVRPRGQEDQIAYC